MKNLIIFSILFIWVMPFSGKADPKHYPSTINEVTVYLQGAMIKRTAQVTLQPGNNEIVLDGLSSYLDINSIHLESSNSITILSVTSSINYLMPVQKSEMVKKLELSLDTLNPTLYRVKNEIKARNIELEMLKQNYKISLGNNGAYVDVLENSADFYLKRMNDLLNELTNLGIKEGEIQKKLDAISRQINETQTKDRSLQSEITVMVASENYAKADFVFNYYVTQAGWTPLYNIRAENTAKEVNLDYDAEIVQKTGEDWKNIKLMLSTGNPSSSGVKPIMTDNVLDFATPETRRWRKKNTPDNFGGYDTEKIAGDVSIKGDRPGVATYYVDGVKMDSKYASDYTNVNQNILATTFEINLKYDILSNGIAKHVRIQQYKLPATFSYSALPKISLEAFLEANITGWEAYNLLPGEASIFLENGFVGKSYIDPGTTKDTLSISFGKDSKIIIKRIRVKEFTKNQFLGANKNQLFGYATSIRNTKQVPVEITIEDQMPVSAQKDIVVELKESHGAQIDAATGKLSWKITLQPDEEKAIKFEYTVKYPKGKIVSGL